MASKARWVPSVPLLFAFAAACIEKSPPVDQEYVKANLLSAEPTPKVAISADLGGKVVYLGADVDKDKVTRGEQIKVVHYWKVVQAPGSEWRVFTHLDGTTPKDWMNLDGTKMRENHPPSKWKAGDIIRDEQTFAVGKGWSSPSATLHVGLYRKGGSGVGDRMPIVTGPNDGKQRVIVKRFAVDVGAPVKEPPPFVVKKARGEIKLDGKDDEEAWKHANSTGAFKDAEGGQPVKKATDARLLWDEKNLYAFITVWDDEIWSPYKKHDDSLWKADVVELFIDADRNRRGYVELQVSPNNVHFDSWFAQTRHQGGDVEWQSQMKSAVKKGDGKWTVELAIPLEAVKGADKDMKVQIPPQLGDRWRLNIVRVDAGEGESIRAAAWAQITVQDFHALDRLNEVVFADADGKYPETAAAGPVRLESLARPKLPPVQIAPPDLTPAKPAPNAPPATE